MRVLSEPRKVTLSGKVIQLCPTLANRERDPVAGGCGFASRPPDRTPGRHFTRIFRVNGGSEGGIQINSEKHIREGKIIGVGKFTEDFCQFVKYLVKPEIDTMCSLRELNKG